MKGNMHSTNERELTDTIILTGTISASGPCEGDYFHFYLLHFDSPRGVVSAAGEKSSSTDHGNLRRFGPRAKRESSFGQLALTQTLI